MLRRKIVGLRATPKESNYNEFVYYIVTFENHSSFIKKTVYDFFFDMFKLLSCILYVALPIYGKARLLVVKWNCNMKLY